MAASEAAVGFWNQRGLLTSWQACPKTNVYRERVDEDVLTDTVNNLNSIQIKLRQTQLWSEFAIIKRIVYKNGNQHRKQFYFHGLRRIVKNLNRLQEIEISKKVADVRNSFPSLLKHQFMNKTPPNYPSVGLIVNILGCLTGAAQIILQLSSFCQETFKFSCSELLSGYFLTFHLTLVSSLSRVWVFLKDFLYAVTECYDIIFPWLNLLEDTQKIENSEAKDLPKSLKIWLEPKSNSTSVTPAKMSTPGTLDKLFASTPRQNSEDTSPRFLLANADSSTEPIDLGESFVPDNINRPFKPPVALIADDFSNLKTKLFAEDPAELQDHEQSSQVNSNDSTRSRKRKATEFLDCQVWSSPRKKLAMELKRFVIRGGLCRHSCSTIHIFGNKTWKRSVERKLRKKLAQRALKKKQRRAEARTGAPFTKKRKRETPSKDNVVTKKRRIATDEEEAHSKKKAKKTRKGKPKHSGKYTTKPKKKRRRKTCESEMTTGKKRKEDSKRDETKTEKRRKENSKRDETKTGKKRKENSKRDETKTEKRRKENSKRDETKTEKRRKENYSKDQKKSNKKQSKVSETKNDKTYKYETRSKMTTNKVSCRSGSDAIGKKRENKRYRRRKIKQQKLEKMKQFKSSKA